MIQILENITKEQLTEIVKNSNSYEQVRKALDLSTSNAARRGLKTLIEKYNISLEHFWRERKDYIDKDKLAAMVANSTAMSEVFEKMGLNKYGGGNYRQFKVWVVKYNLDTSHFTGQSHQKNKKGQNRFTTEEILVENSPYGGSSSSLKKRLVQEGILKNECCECGLTEWRGKKLVIQLEHMNGNHTDNRRENLTMLCPNCHSQTETYCGKNNKK